MLLHERLEIRHEGYIVIRVANGAFVPVLGYSLCARRIYQVTIITSRHAVERFECSLIKEIARISSGMVGERSSDESVGTGRNEETEEAAKIVWVLRD